MKRTLLVLILGVITTCIGVYAHQRTTVVQDPNSDDLYRNLSRALLVEQVYKGSDLTGMELSVVKRSNYVFVTSHFPEYSLLYTYTVVWLKAPLMNLGTYKEGIIKPDNFVQTEASDEKFSRATITFVKEFDKRNARKPKS